MMASHLWQTVGREEETDRRYLPPCPSPSQEKKGIMIVAWE